MTSVKSSQIAEVDHDGTQLTVKFHSGATYDYPDVPKELYDRMMAAHDAGESIGKFFHKHVKMGGFSFNKREDKADDDSDGHHEEA